MYGLARGASMLVGAAVAGALLWFATQFEATNVAAYWAFVGLLAAAGLVLALAQIVGGWTKWGAPRITGGAFLLGFLPALVVGGWVLLASQPEGAWMQATAESWAAGIGAGGLLETLTAVLPAIAFALGLLFGYTFDTTGGRVVAAEPAPANDAARRIDDDEHVYDPATREDRAAEDEPVTAERREAYAADEYEEHRVDDDYREPDREVVRSLSGRGDERREAEDRTRDDGTWSHGAADADRSRDTSWTRAGNEDGRSHDAETPGARKRSERDVRDREEHGERRRGWFTRR